MQRRHRLADYGRPKGRPRIDAARVTATPLHPPKPFSGASEIYEFRSARSALSYSSRGFLNFPRSACFWPRSARSATQAPVARGLDADATDRLRIETSTTREGSIRWLHVLGRQDLHEKVTGLPLIHAEGLTGGSRSSSPGCLWPLRFQKLPTEGSHEQEAE